VADTRTQSVVVTASKDLMEQIDGMIKELDIQSDKDQTVTTVPIIHGDINQVLQALQSAFPASNTRNSTTTSPQNSALQARQQANAASQGNSSTTLGNSSVSGSRGGGSRGVIGGN
jgi:hypothetical protein